jgi:hypothetical protein
MSSATIQKPPFLSLPFSLLLSIFEYLSVNDVFVLFGVCKQLHLLKSKGKNHSLWKSLCEKKWKELGADRWLSGLVSAKWKNLGFEDTLLMPEGRDWKWMAVCLAAQTTPCSPQNATAENGDVTTFGFCRTEGSEERFYLGEYQGDKPHGKGVEILADRYLYSGDWKNGKWHGKGVVLSSNPDTGGLYRGELIESKSQGKGVKIWNNGPSYDGEWKENRMHGEGTYIWDSGERYDGNWENGMMSGMGTNFWSDGTKHIGLWKNGAAHGRGRRFHNNGAVTDGEWQNGHQVFVYSLSPPLL